MTHIAEFLILVVSIKRPHIVLRQSYTIYLCRPSWPLNLDFGLATTIISCFSLILSPRLPSNLWTLDILLFKLGWTRNKIDDIIVYYPIQIWNCSKDDWWSMHGFSPGSWIEFFRFCRIKASTQIVDWSAPALPRRVFVETPELYRNFAETSCAAMTFPGPQWFQTFRWLLCKYFVSLIVAILDLTTPDGFRSRPSMVRRHCFRISTISFFLLRCLRCLSTEVRPSKKSTW